jgi:competence protein ComEC
MLVRQLKKIQKALILGIVGMSLLLFWLLVSDTHDARVYFLNVGQGDASLIMLPDDIQIVIDGGPNGDIARKIGMYLPFYDRTIEYMLLTHPHSDHITGLEEIARRYNVKTFIYNGVTRDLPVFTSLLTILDDQRTEIIIVDAERTLTISQDTRLELLFPDHTLKPIEYEDYNDSSVIARFVYGATAFLFMGDASIEAERYLVEKGIDLKANVLKVGHQGSKTSSDPLFINTVDPNFGVIMVGENNYGHPHYRTIKTLEDSRVKILQTNLEGDILFTSDGYESIRRKP